MKAERRMNRDKATDLAALLEALDHVRQRRVGQSIAVIGEKDLLVRDEMFHRHQAFADIAPDSGVDQRDAPIWRRLAREFRPSCRNSK